MINIKIHFKIFVFIFNICLCLYFFNNNASTLNTNRIEKIKNNNQEDKKFKMSKELSKNNDKYQISLTCQGSSFENQSPIYATLIFDSTSSMGTKDVASDEEHDPNYNSNTTRWQIASDSAKAYVDKLYKSNPNREVNINIVSFGYGARVHTGKETFPDFIPLGGNERKNPSKTSNISDISGALPGYIGGYRGSDSNIHALFSNESLNEFELVTKNGSDSLFFNNPETINHIIDGISYYSGTNNQSGFLLTERILDKIKNKDAQKFMIYFSDGETAASCTFAKLYDIFSLSPEINLENMYNKTIDKNFINNLMQKCDDSFVNPFDGNWHNLETSASAGARLKTAQDIVKNAKILPNLDQESYQIIQNTPDTSDPFNVNEQSSIQLAKDFFKAVHTLLEKQGLYDQEIGYKDVNGYWNSVLKSVIFQAEIRTPYYDSSGQIITGESIPIKFSKIPNEDQKDIRINILDYVEGSSANVSGSLSSKNFTLSTTYRLKQKWPIFVIDIGKSITDIEGMRKYATSFSDNFYIDDSVDYFYHCYYDDKFYDAYHIASGLLPSTMKQVAVKNSQNLRNIKIYDTLADNFYFAPINNDNVFITLKAYQNEKLIEEQKPIEDNVFLNNRTICALIGNLWDEETAKLLSKNSQEKFYFSGAFIFTILIDCEKIPTDIWIKTNKNAYFTFDDNRESPEFKSPEFYIFFKNSDDIVPDTKINHNFLLIGTIFFSDCALLCLYSFLKNKIL